MRRVAIREKILNYTIENLLWASESSSIYQVVDEKTEQKNCIKILKKEYPSLTAVEQLEREWHIAKTWPDLPTIIQPHRLLKYGHIPFLVMDNFTGLSLRKWLDMQQQILFYSLLIIGHRLASLLASLHRHDMVFGSLSMDHLLFDPVKEEIKLADYSELFLPGEPLVSTIPATEQMGYAAPERTGRTDTLFDSRCDIYSLGAILYECACGHPPFPVDDLLLLNREILALKPKPLWEAAPHLPLSFCKIVMNCLAKESSQRYQTAKEVQNLLKWQLELLEDKGEDKAAFISPQAFNPLVLAAKKLYGRKEEKEDLLQAAQAAFNGEKAWITLIGHPGVGKSFLLEEIYKKLAENRSYNILYSPKKELKAAFPGGCLRYIFRTLFQQVIAYTEENDWEELQRHLASGWRGSRHQLVNFIPELSVFFNESFSPHEEAGWELPSFSLIRSLFQFFGSFKKPIFLFIDDVDQIDHNSFTILANLFEIQALPYFFLVTTQSAFLSSSAAQTILHLAPMAGEDICSYLSDVFHLTEETVAPLAELVLRKTEGFPAAIVPFLEDLIGDEIIWYNGEAHHWQWNIEHIYKEIYAENALAAQRLKIGKLPENCQWLLFLAAQLGMVFDLRLLAYIAHLPIDVCFGMLAPAFAVGIIEPEDRRLLSTPSEQPFSSLLQANVSTYCKFFHPQLYDVAQAFIKDSQDQERRSIHKGVGLYLLERCSEKELPKKIEEILLHLNSAIESFYQPSEEIFLAELNYRGSCCAKQSGKLFLAFEFITIARSLIKEEYWQSDYKIAYKIYLESVEIAYLIKRFDQIEPFSEIILKRAQTNQDKGKLYTWKVNYYMSSSLPKKAITEGLRCLQLFNIQLEEHSSRFKLLARLIPLAFRLGFTGFYKLRRLPPMSDETSLFLMEHMASLCAPAFLINKILMVQLSISMIEISLKYGNCAQTSFAYTTYALTLAAVFKDYKGAYVFAELGVYLANHFDNDLYRCRNNFCMGTFIAPWVISRKRCSAYLNTSYSAGVACNDILFTSYLAVQYGFADGNFYKNIAQATLYVNRYHEEVINSKHPFAIAYHLIEKLFCDLLQSPNPESYTLTSPSFDEESFVETLKINHALQVPYQLYISFKGLLFFLFGQYEAGWELFVNSEKTREYINIMRPIGDIVFFQGMTAAALIKEGKADKEKCKQLWYRLRKSRKKFHIWSGNCSLNYGARAKLLDAQWAFLKRKISQAEKFYNEAILLAQEGESTLDEAVANEQLALLYLHEGTVSAASAHIREAHYCYYRWGAASKRAQLERLYPEWLVHTEEKTALKPSAFFHFESILPSTDRVVKGLSYINELIHSSKAIASSTPDEGGLLQLLSEALAGCRGEELTLFCKNHNEWCVMADIHQNGFKKISLPSSNPISEEISIQKQDIISKSFNKQEIITIATSLEGNKVTYFDVAAPLVHAHSPPLAIYLTACSSFQKEFFAAMTIIIPQAAMATENVILNDYLIKTTNKLKTFHARLENYSQRLEQQVEGRTTELQKKNSQLNLAFQQTQEIQQKIIEQEKLATIGTLAQDVSVEIRNPLMRISALLHDAEQPLQFLHQAAAEKNEDISTLTILEQNIRKISEHSQRASAVINMLQISSHEKRDSYPEMSLEALLNELALWLQEEFIAKTSNILMVEREGPKLEIYSTAPYPEIGHALSNIFDNAFYTMQKKQELMENEYVPMFTISTDLSSDYIEIILKDNGLGISVQNKERIFVPFFTTKPTGRGHGLGLSTSYEIIVQRCQGELSFQSVEGHYTSFTIRLPRKVA